MPYCTQEDIINRLSQTELIQLTDDDGTGSVNDGVVNAAIADADAEIDTYVGSRYAIPVAPAPAILTRASAVIAIYFLSQRRGGRDPVKFDKYVKELSLLADVRDGKLDLPGISSEDYLLSTTSGNSQEFTRTKRDENGNIVERGSTEVW